MKSMHELGVSIPIKKPLVVRNLKNVSIEQREKALKHAEYNLCSFPADLLTLDFQTDSGTGAMTDFQWSALFQGDESYSRNKGYYVLLDAIRDTFERGDNPKRAINLILSGETNVDKLLDELYLTSNEGGFVNGGKFQLSRPNAFLLPQGRCSEHLLFSTLASVLKEIDPDREYYIPSNGHFDSTEAHIAVNGIHPISMVSKNIMDDFPVDQMDTRNPFKGNVDPKELEDFIQEKGPESIPLLYLTITNNRAAGQPVSMLNIKAVNKLSKRYDIPLFLDACRFAENAEFIKKFEENYKKKSIRAIVQEIFSNADGFTISFKKDGMANMGGGLFFRDQGKFHRQFSINKKDIGYRLKEKQILIFGNDSYGALSGRDIMALAAGLNEIVREEYLSERIQLLSYFGRNLMDNGVPVVLPTAGHAIYLNMDKFFEGMNVSILDFRAVGFVIELIRHYGIRTSELGPYAFEWDLKPPEQRKSILNLVRLALPRNMYGKSDIDYAIAAITELYHNREKIPKVKIIRGANLRLRHFQCGLQPLYQ